MKETIKAIMIFIISMIAGLIGFALLSGFIIIIAMVLKIL